MREYNHRMKEKIFPRKGLHCANNIADKIEKEDMYYVAETPEKCKCTVIAETPEKDEESPLIVSPIIKRLARHKFEIPEDESLNLLDLPYQRSLFSNKVENKKSSRKTPLANNDENKQYKFAYISETVKSKEIRKQLPRFTCRDCENYFYMKIEEGFSPKQISKLIDKCSKHRGLKPPLTPEHFWDPDIIEGDPESPRNKTQPGSPLSTRKRRAEARKKKLYQE